MIRLFRVFIPASVLALLVCDIVLVLACFIVAVQCVLDADALLFLTVEGGLARIAVVALSIVTGLYLSDLYERLRVRNSLELVQQLCVVIGGALLFQALLSYLSPPWILPRWIMLVGCLLCLAVLPAWRIFYSRVGVKAFGVERLLYVGMTPALLEAALHLQSHPELGFENIGYLSAPGQEPIEGLPYLGAFKELKRLVKELNPSRIVVALPDSSASVPVGVLLELRAAGMIIEEAGALYQVAFGRVSCSELRPSQLIFSDGFSASGGYLALRDLYSWIIALVGAIIAFPIMVAVAMAVRLTSPGPIFYRQTRTGGGGEPFVLFKFRSMRVDAEAATGAVWAMKDDPRVTPIGKWLRRLRLDELPQLFNVLRGEMAIVGPRPERPEFVTSLSEAIPYYQQRHCVKPGITGWAQIRHQYTDSMEDTVIKLEYDLYYIRNLSPTFDAYIIFHTAKVMLLGRGAH